MGKKKAQAPPPRPAVSPVSLAILYYELRKEWPVPQRLLDSKMDDLRKDRHFVAAVDEWLDGLGLSEEVGVEGNLHPHGQGALAVRKFIEEGGFVAYCPSSSSNDHTGLLYRQARRSRENASAQADKLLAEEVAAKEKTKGKEKEAAVEAAAGSSGGDSVGSLNETVITSLEEKITALRKEIAEDVTAWREQLQRLTALEGDTSHREQQITALEDDLIMLKQQEQRITALDRQAAPMRSIVAAFQAMYKRKLVESFRVKAAAMIPDAVWKGDAPDIGWWCGFILDPTRIAVLSSASGIEFDVPTLARTRYDGKSIQRGGGAAHMVTDEPEVYATLVCQYGGAAREEMGKIYRLVFGCDAAEDAVEDVECCHCPVHCPEGVE